MGNDVSSVSSSSLPTAPTTIQTTEAVTGSHQLKITNYSQTKGMGVGKHISSAPFSVGCCTWAIQYYPGGAEKFYESYISLSLCLCRGPRTAHALFNFALLDWEEIPRDDAESSKLSSHVFSLGDVCVVHFIKRKLFEASSYLKADSFTINCTMTVMKYPCVPENKITQLITIPPCDLHQQLHHLLASGLGADVTFQGDGETFQAHRCVLAASSPVFRAQLFGQMKEKEMNWIRIDEIEAPVFKAMLNFIYTGRIILDDATDEQRQHVTSFHRESYWMHQHLLVVADRFGLERLRSLCQVLLCRNLDVRNVSTSLVLAEQHDCQQLKAACLKYIASKRILKRVMATDGFQHLVASCPGVLDEINATLSAQTTGAIISGSLLTVIILSLSFLWIVSMYFIC